MLNIKIRNKLLILELLGDLDMAGALEFQRYVEAHRDKFLSVLVDMSKIKFLSSPGVGVLLTLYKGGFSVGCVVENDSQVESILKVQGMETLISVFNDEKEAIHFLSEDFSDVKI